MRGRWFAMAGALGGAALSSRPLPAQVTTPPAPASPAPTPAFRTLRPTRTEQPVTLDGRLDEADWARATVAGDFVQSEPRTGQPATEATEVRVLYDGDRLYIGAVLHTARSARLVTNDIKKDFKEDDQDDFEVMLDTFHDRRNGYVFITNAAGARSDRQFANEGREINTSWDGIWQVKTQRTGDGWTLEMAIPFRGLRFLPNEASTWGLNFARRLRRKNEIDFWTPIPRAFNIYRASMAGELRGLDVGIASRDLRMKPYAMGRTLRDVGGLKATPSEAVGLDVTYGITKNLTMNVSVNPDFAQVEADEQQVNLTQFSQFFPEKREFFLENSGTFYVGDAARNNKVNSAPTPDEDMLLFFSRRIGLSPTGAPVPIPGGVRLTGSTGGFTIGGLAMQTQHSATRPANRYGVFRLRRNLRPGSDVGMILLDREAIGTGAAGNWNRVLGFDANVRLPHTWDWSSYAVGTRTPGRDGGQYSWRSSLNHEDNFFHGKIGVLEVGKNFQDDLGFFRRTDTRKYLADIGIRPRPQWLAKIRTREMHPHITWNYYETLDGRMSAKNLHSGYTMFLRSGAFFELSGNPQFQRIDTPFRINKRIAAIPSGSYGWMEWTAKGATDLSRRLAATYTITEGGLWSGTQHTQNVTVTARPSPHFTATVGASRTQAHLEQPNADFETTLWTVRTNYSATTNMFVDALAQYDPHAHLLNANVRFNLIHHPLSDVFVVLNEQKITMPDAPATGFSVILKYTQMFAF